jgi:flagellar basal body rod protein FlgG
MDAGSDIFNTNNNSGIDSYVPDNSVSGEVTQNIYESFNVGDEYCSE